MILIGIGGNIASPRFGRPHNTLAAALQALGEDALILAIKPTGLFGRE